MPKGYKFIEHTADIEFLAFGETLDELFENCLLAMFDTSADIDRLEKSDAKEFSFDIEVKAKNINELVWEILQTALSEAEAEGLFAFSADESSYSFENKEHHFFATCYAKKKTQKYSKMDVKGVSKFDLKFKESGVDYPEMDHKYEVSVVLDV